MPRFDSLRRLPLLRGLAVFCLWACSSLTAVANEPPATIDCDLLLRQGLVCDGSLAEPKVGDVALLKGKIVAVGEFKTGRVGREIDCTGLVIAPGFIDLHTHSDDSIVDPSTRANINYLLQGCTTIVTGNCGSGPTNVAAFYKKIEAGGAGANVLHLIPHGSIREIVLRRDNRLATPEELTRLRELVRQGMKDGAWGLSTGLIYVPSSYSDTAELTALAEVVGEFGGLYASHIRGENTVLLKAVAEAIEIGEKAHTPVHISHFKASGRDAWGLIREAAKLVETARTAGRRVTADQYPYVASSTSLEATLIPTWARAGGSDALIARIDHPEEGRRLREEILDSLSRADGGAAVRIARYSPHPDWIGLNLVQIAEKESRMPLDIVLEITRNGGAAIVNFSMSEDDVRYAMTLPWVATASDGRGYLPGADKPHPRSYGTFSRKIGYYAIREQAVPLGQAIYSSSGLPAEILGLTDRGMLRPNFAADVVVFDPKTFIDTATFDEPHQYSTGLRHAFINGVPTISHGIPTGALAGVVLRKPTQPASHPR
jgi:N-acyl-D-amino-acid deacylase